MFSDPAIAIAAIIGLTAVAWLVHYDRLERRADAARARAREIAALHHQIADANENTRRATDHWAAAHERAELAWTEVDRVKAHLDDAITELALRPEPDPIVRFVHRGGRTIDDLCDHFDDPDLGGRVGELVDSDQLRRVNVDGQVLICYQRPKPALTGRPMGDMGRVVALAAQPALAEVPA